MIRRTFVQLISGMLLPCPQLLAGIVAKPTLPQLEAMPRLPAGIADIADPEWLREWKKIPRLELAPEDLTDHGDPHQQALAADIFPCIQNGMPFTFCYQGGSEPGVVRQVLPVQIFILDYFSYYYQRCDDPVEIPDPDIVPIYLLAWCLTRNAPRTFRLDRMHETPQHTIAS